MCPTANLLSFSFPQYYDGKCSYVGFMALDPATGLMRRKRYKLDRIHGAKERKKYAQLLISSLLQKLMSGWCPFTKEEPIRTRTPFLEVFTQYQKAIEHDGETGILRPDSLKSYKSNLKVFKEYLEMYGKLTYIDELSTGKVQSFLDWLIHEKNNSPRTHNNYLVWLGVFCRWLMKHEYISGDLPTKDIKPLREPKEKNRIVLSEKQLTDLRTYCEQNNKHYLLVCYLLYYCMIRPKELSMLKIGDIKLKDGVITISDEVSKNRRDANVTLPVKVIHLMLDLDIFNYPSSFYLFGDGFMPSKTFKVCKHMSDWWDYHVRRDLHWGKELKLYSLKDTGITNLLHKTDVLTVRDQARHSDISITNTYADRRKDAVMDVQIWDAEDSI